LREGLYAFAVLKPYDDREGVVLVATIVDTI
jgi:hypothetical protein